MVKLKGALCGSGEMSIESGTKLGDDEGIGGVVTPSHRTGGVLVPSVGQRQQRRSIQAHKTGGISSVAQAYPGCPAVGRGSR